MDRETKQALLTAADMQGLSAEFLELLADAERYRWLRDEAGALSTFTAAYWNTSTPEQLDAAIDEAMAGD